MLIFQADQDSERDYGLKGYYNTGEGGRFGPSHRRGAGSWSAWQVCGGDQAGGLGMWGPGPGSALCKKEELIF